MDLFTHFMLEIKPASTGRGEVFFLLAVSGGADSVVLCHLFERSGLAYAIAQANFQLRGPESERDEQFVTALAAQYRRPVYIKHFNTAAYAAEHKLSTQVAARELRYKWFRQILTEKGGEGCIVTAHHADDNIETVLINFFRGTGLKGLTGMDRLINQVYRPLLAFRKKDILAYAQAQGLPFVEDSSNAANYYTRNYFRNELLPAVEKVFAGVEENILNNIHRLTEVQQVYDEAIITYKNKLITQQGNEEHIPILKLRKLQALRTIVWEIIKNKGFSAAQTNEVIRLMDADNGSVIYAENFRILKNRKWLIISPVSVIDRNTIRIIEPGVKTITFEKHVLHIDYLPMQRPFSVPTSPLVACIDSRVIQYPLMVRRWKTGDYFYPLGMKKKKKLSRFFIDQKLSRLQKEDAWVVESNKKIVWVVGYRIDDRFKIIDSTETMITLSLADGFALSQNL